MKFAVVLVLAVCLPAAFGYSCQSLVNATDFVCDVDGAWRTSQNSWINNDNNDEAVIDQAFDGQVEWRQEYAEFQADLAEALIDFTNTSARREAQQSCKEAIPDRVYHFRFERYISGTKYEVKEWLYKGFVPVEEAWDRYCVLYVEESFNALNLPTGPPRIRQNVVVERYGRSIADLQGAWLRGSSGHLVNLDSGAGCNTYFRPKDVQTRCLMKNDEIRFPTEYFCNRNYETRVTPLGVLQNYGGAQTSLRYGCQQYTWDSDSNDDNIEDTCKRMYFINQYRGQNAFKLGQYPGAGTGTYPITSTSVTPVNTPRTTFNTQGTLCEYRISKNSWSGLTDFGKHRCQ